MNYLIDTNIIIQILRGNNNLTNLVNSLVSVIDSTVYVESLQGSKSNAEKQRVKTLINSFSLIRFTPDVSKKTIELIDGLLQFAQSIFARCSNCGLLFGV